MTAVIADAGYRGFREYLFERGDDAAADVGRGGPLARRHDAHAVHDDRVGVGSTYVDPDAHG